MHFPMIPEPFGVSIALSWQIGQISVYFSEHLCNSLLVPIWLLLNYLFITLC